MNSSYWRAWIRARWEKVVGAASALVGVVLAIAGWHGAANESLTTEQIPYLASGAVGGLIALGIGATLWLSADMRDEYFKLDELHTWLREHDGGSPTVEPADRSS